ncbi:N-acetylmuramoyl-L-alanine amidase family protein [Negadavirga shengliensis]|uniref:N-acetylmuramoyl-L-alanine amidase n=1 Tax=Negadavirga shengliensis TaxID=1389218 RepID=A0ABV9T484_9BACT
MIKYSVAFLFIAVCLGSLSAQTENYPVAGKIVCIDPGHGGTSETDQYRVGPGGEREEWINLRVALLLRDLLEEAGAKVLMTRTEDVFIPLEERSRLAVDGGADVFISIHHNATADKQVNFPIIYFHGSALENQASVKLGGLVAKELKRRLFNAQSPVSLVSDFTIFPKSGTNVLRSTYGIPAVIGEASFFSHPKEEKRLKRRAYNKKEARAYFEALNRFFGMEDIPAIKDKIGPFEIPAFEVFQEADRMRPEALEWKANYEEGKNLAELGGPVSYDSAYDLLTLSAKSFPDSYVARLCHGLRAMILEARGEKEKAETEARRVEAFYVIID